MSRDHVKETTAGFVAIVGGREFGTWATRAIAQAGMKVEQRRARTKLEAIAQGGIERGADWDDQMSPDVIFTDAFDLAFDALIDSGIDQESARDVAGDVARRFAQP